MTTNDINNTRYCGTLIVVGRRAHACRSPGLITAARSCSNLVTSLPISRVHRVEWKFISFVSLYDRSVGSYWNFEEISRLSRSILNDLYREQNFHFDYNNGSVIGNFNFPESRTTHLSIYVGTAIRFASNILCQRAKKLPRLSCTLMIREPSLRELISVPPRSGYYVRLSPNWHENRSD